MIKNFFIKFFHNKKGIEDVKDIPESLLKLIVIITLFLILIGILLIIKKRLQ